MQVASGDRCSSPDLPEYDSDDEAEDVSSSADGVVVPPSHIVNERAIWLEQQQVGQITFTETSKKLLVDMLNEVYVQLQPKQADWDARQIVIQFITKFVNHKIPGSCISAFGSFVMDLFTSSSDLDLSLNLADGRCDRSRNDKVHYLRKVAKALYGLQNGQRQSVQKIETVYRAAVPVVKFVECKTGIECDISVENNDGVLKSQVLGMFSTMDSRFRQLCYLVKAWAKKHNVNSSKNGTLNSLSICLLVAFHLQTRSPAILPPFSVFMEGLHLPDIGSCLQTVELRVKEYKESGFGQDNTESVPELYGSFFLKLLAVESLWGQGLCSSTYEGRWISKIWPKNHIGCISVEDFADRTQNVARSVSRKEFELIYHVLQSTVSNLKDPVYDVLEAKDLKAYLFGSIRQRHRGTHHGVAAVNTGTWQSGNGWSQPATERTNLPGNRGHESFSDSSLGTDGTWGQKAPTPVYAEQNQAGQGPAHRANGFRKVGQSTRIPKVSTGFDSHAQGENRGVHHQGRRYERPGMNGYRMHYPPLDSRSNPAGQSMKQVAVHPSSGYTDFGPGYRDWDSGYRREDFHTTPAAPDSGYSGGYIHREVDFPTIDAEPRVQYPETLSTGYAGLVEPSQMTYAAAGNRPRSHHTSPSPSIPSGAHQMQRSERYRHNHRGRRHHPPGADGRVQQYSTNGYQVHMGGNAHWQAQSSRQIINF
ncbi:unnamed protein product [Calypogeia fissa]